MAEHVQNFGAISYVILRLSPRIYVSLWNAKCQVENSVKVMLQRRHLRAFQENALSGYPSTNSGKRTTKLDGDTHNLWIGSPFVGCIGGWLWRFTLEISLRCGCTPRVHGLEALRIDHADSRRWTFSRTFLWARLRPLPYPTHLPIRYIIDKRVSPVLCQVSMTMSLPSLDKLTISPRLNALRKSLHDVSNPHLCSTIRRSSHAACVAGMPGVRSLCL